MEYLGAPRCLASFQHAMVDATPTFLTRYKCHPPLLNHVLEGTSNILNPWGASTLALVTSRLLSLPSIPHRSSKALISTLVQLEMARHPIN